MGEDIIPILRSQFRVGRVVLVFQTEIQTSATTNLAATVSSHVVMVTCIGGVASIGEAFDEAL